MRVTARQQKSEGGLRSVCQGPRGYEISVDGKRVGSVSWAANIFAAPRGRAHWYWYASVGGASRNSSQKDAYYDTREEARDACIEWVKATARQVSRPDCPHGWGESISLCPKCDPAQKRSSDTKGVTR